MRHTQIGAAHQPSIYVQLEHTLDLLIRHTCPLPPFWVDSGKIEPPPLLFTESTIETLDTQNANIGNNDIRWADGAYISTSET